MTKISDLKMLDDLGIGRPFIRGEDVPIRNCWHFSTDGNTTDVIFMDETDFIDAMNRIYIILQKYSVIILAFCLMDNHVHFVMYGEFDECNRFIHEFVRRTSQAIVVRHNLRKHLSTLHVSHQVVDTDSYLKTVICYVLKNPSAAGLPYNFYDYPWSSGSLYFRHRGLWTTPMWVEEETYSQLGTNKIKKELKTRITGIGNVEMVGGIILPTNYIPIDIVESIFRTHKSFLYFISRTKENDVESRGDVVSPLSIPDSELRQRKQEKCFEMFGVSSTRTLSVEQRLRLAQSLKWEYRSSPKQLARICGLIYKEVKSLL